MSDFEAASKWLTTSPSAGHLDNETKLELYGLYKFALTGSGPTGKRPGIFSFEARHKYDAWARIATAFGGRPDDAKARYVEVARGAGWMGNASPGAEAGEGGVEVEVKKKSGGMGFGPSVSVMEREEGEEGALHDAASEGDVAALDKLLERNNVNIKDEYGFTPLHLAADRGRTEVVKLLLERGADKAILDPDEQTACDLAAVSGRDDIVALLR